MISGNINLYEVPKPKSHLKDLDEYEGYGHYIYQKYDDTDWEAKVLKAIELAIEKGFAIGTKVYRQWGNNTTKYYGTVTSFNRGKSAYRFHSGKHEVLNVQWVSGYMGSASPEELAIETENTNETDQNHCAII